MIVIAGYGFVGKAYYEALKKTEEIAIVDPKYTEKKISDFPTVKGIVICVPTPQSEDGSCDMKYVISVLNECPVQVPVMIKSTISLEGWNFISNYFRDHTITFSPEFLRANSAIEDVLATKNIILAGGNSQFWSEVYTRAFPKAQIYYMSVEEAITVKYFRNSFLATKVAFFNQIYDYCEKLGVDYRYVREGISLDDRIGSSHTYVFEDDRGFGGYCFPKDTAALLHTSKKELDVDLSILKAAVEYNNKLRND
jgi:UDPglucose 6-dehydrogenase